MRWERLFEDLEARLESEALRERAAEVADRTRHERAQVDLQSRLLASVGAGAVTVRLQASSLAGQLLDVGPDWILIEVGTDGSVLVPMAAIRSLTGLAPGARTASVVARRFALGAALRAISRDRAPVEIDVGGLQLAGTIDVVAADHLEVAEHAADVPRRTRDVTALHVLTFAGLQSVRRLRP
jgi:hypothetical protein